MRFINGPPPESRTLDPVAAGWTPLREPNSKGFLVACTLIAVPLMVGAFVVLFYNRPVWRPMLRAHPWALAGFATALLAMVPVHEFIHALAYRCGLRSPNLMIGIWLRRGLAYVLCDEPLPRRRVLLMLAAPFLTLSVLPLFALPFLSAAWLPLVEFLCLLHAGICVGDFATFGRLWTQAPHNALIHNQGWNTYWTVANETNLA